MFWSISNDSKIKSASLLSFDVWSLWEIKPTIQIGLLSYPSIYVQYDTHITVVISYILHNKEMHIKVSQTATIFVYFKEWHGI